MFMRQTFRWTQWLSNWGCVLPDWKRRKSWDNWWMMMLGTLLWLLQLMQETLLWSNSSCPWVPMLKRRTMSVFAYFFSRNWKRNVKLRSNKLIQNGYTALLLAARSGRLEVVQLLLNARANVNSKNNVWCFRVSLFQFFFLIFRCFFSGCNLDGLECIDVGCSWKSCWHCWNVAHRWSKRQRQRLQCVLRLMIVYMWCFFVLFKFVRFLIFTLLVLCFRIVLHWWLHALVNTYLLQCFWLPQEQRYTHT